MSTSPLVPRNEGACSQKYVTSNDQEEGNDIFTHQDPHLLLPEESAKDTGEGESHLEWWKPI